MSPAILCGATELALVTGGLLLAPALASAGGPADAVGKAGSAPGEGCTSTTAT